jgi:hypothetical protein
MPHLLPVLLAGIVLADPMCGSGTLLIEAALIATGTAPGLLLRNTWPFEAWHDHDKQVWENKNIKNKQKHCETLHHVFVMLCLFDAFFQCINCFYLVPCGKQNAAAICLFASRAAARFMHALHHSTSHRCITPASLLLAGPGGVA